MHVLFAHKEYPGHFGHVAARLVRDHGFTCTFVFSNLPARLRQQPGGGAPVVVPQPGAGASPPLIDGVRDGVRLIQYLTRGAARDTNPASLHFEISAWHAQAVAQALLARPGIRPDLIVGHASYGTALHLGDLYRRPVINYCEYYHSLERSHLLFRPEFPPRELELQARHAFNAVNLLGLEHSSACYGPTEWQRSLFPTAYQAKIRTIFDGIDRSFWQRRQVGRRIGGRTIPSGTKVVTYCAYGLEPTRGFDVFMRMAKRICAARRDVLFVVVGSDRSYYAAGLPQGATFRDHVLAQDRYDLSRFLFTGQILEEQLVEILSLSDLHVYLTVPFVLSWSMMDALACGCTVLASDTPPVREMIVHEKNGLLARFDDVEGLASSALRVLDDPEAFRPLALEGTRLIDERYSMDVTIPRTVAFYRDVAGGTS